jgi:fluoroacetyl-CoA thioesterase
MRQSLRPGLQGIYRFPVTAAQSVPSIYPEAPDFQLMPAVLATGYLVALCEWACIELVKPHLDWPREQSLGTHVDVSHVAPTPPGRTLEIEARLVAVEGRKLSFTVRAHDGVALVSEGRHERHVIAAERFAARLAAEAAA